MSRLLIVPATETVESIIKVEQLESVAQESVTVKQTVTVSGPAYVCEGFCIVDVFPSPKSQLHEMILELVVLASLNCTVNAFGVDVKLAAGGLQATTVTESHVLSVPQVSVIDRQTRYVPAAVYVWDGFWVLSVPPSPNVHAHAVGDPGV